MADVFVKNIHTNSIKVPIVVDKNAYEKRFTIAGYDGVGGISSNGYTRITEAEYEACKKEKLFTYFVELGKLVVYDKQPSEAMSSHDALVNAKKEAGEYQKEISELKKQNEKLQKQLEESEAKYKELAAVSGTGKGKAKDDVKEPML